MSGDPPRFDLQSHSLHSDGELAPRDVVFTAAAAGVELLALTDHDTVDGVPEAGIAAEHAGIRLITGVEISALDVDRRDLHVLGYGIDPSDARLNERLKYFRGDRQRRAQRMTEALRRLGFELDDAVLRNRVEAGNSIGRPHLAEAVVNHPANRPRLEREGRLDPSAFLEAYLIPGRAAFCPRESPTVPEAIEAIHAAGGAAVWAHPFWDVASAEDVLKTIDRFRDAGIDGVECFYATHTREQAELLADRCAELRMLSTGSSDFHGPRHRQFSGFRAFSTYGRAPTLGSITG